MDHFIRRFITFNMTAAEFNCACADLSQERGGCYVIAQYNGYSLGQSKFNNHYMIFDPEGNWCLHASYDKPLTEEEGIEKIKIFLTLREEGVFE